MLILREHVVSRILTLHKHGKLELMMSTFRMKFKLNVIGAQLEVTFFLTPFSPILRDTVVEILVNTPST